jgi:magnesium-transporting ATPase (P-type)
VEAVLRAGLLCNDATFSKGHFVVGNPIVEGTNGERQVIVKGAPETVLSRCLLVPTQAQAVRRSGRHPIRIVRPRAVQRA